MATGSDQQGVNKQLNTIQGQVKSMQTEQAGLGTRMDKVVNDANEIFKNCKKYVDEANAKQDKRLEAIIKEANEIFKNCKKYVDDANKTQDKKIDALAKQVNKKK